MLDTAFMQILDMTKTASIVILFVILTRLILKKAPKIFSYVLWAVVLFRLLCPVSIELPVSAVPEFTPVAYSYSLEDEPVSFFGASEAAYQTVGDVLNGGIDIQHVRTTECDESGNVRYASAWWWEVLILFGQYVWLFGIAVMLVYSLVVYYKLRRKLVGAVLLRDNIFLSDYITSPFVMGMFRPKIYLPSTLTENEQEYIILHEQHHIRRFDHITKAFAFLALCIHWFNPLVWLSFVLYGKDMEMSCDEAVIRKMGAQIRVDYSSSLLSLATGRRIIAGSPLAFGEGDTKGRIKNLANYKKPAFWIVLIALVASVVLALCFMTDPKGANGGYKTFNGLDEIKEFSFSMNEIMIDCHTYTVIKGDNDYFEAKQDDGFAYSDIKSFLRSLELGVMVDGELNHKQEIQSDVVIRMLCEDDYEFSVVLFDNYQKLYIYKAESNGKHFSRSKDYVVLNPDEVKEFFENESYKRHALWAFDPASSAYGFQELHLFVDEKFIISDEVRGEGVIQSVADEERGLKGITWRPDVTNMQKDYNIIIPVTYEGKSSAFNITLTETGRKKFRTYYNVRSENTVLSSWGSGYEFVLGFPETKKNDTDSVTFYDLEADGFNMQLIVDLLKTNKAVIRNGQNEAEVYKCDNIIAALEGLWWEYEKGYYSHPSAEELERMKSYSIEVSDRKNKKYFVNFDKNGSVMWFSNNTGAYSHTFKVKNSSDITVRSFFGNEEFFNYSFVWDYNSTANTYSYGHLNLIVDGEYESYTATCESGSLTTATISDDRSHGIVQSDPVKKITCTKDDNLIWMPDLSAPENVYFELKLANGETTDFFVHINQIGTNYSGSTLYEITAEYANINMEENGVVHFEQTYEKWWHYNPYAGATFHYITEYILPEGYEIKTAEATSGTATIENIYYNEPDKGKCVKWSPDLNTDKAEIVITALKNGKEVQFRIYVSLSDENTEGGTKWYKISPINCKMREKDVSTYLLSEK